MKRTSVEAFNSLTKEYKDHIFVKVATAMSKKLKAGGTYEEISVAVGEKPDRIWKRLSEMVNAKILMNLPSTRPTSSGRKAMVRNLTPNWEKHLLKQLKKVG